MIAKFLPVNTTSIFCTGNKLEVTAEVIREGDEDGSSSPFVLIVSASMLTGAALAMTAAEYVPVVFDGVAESYRGMYATRDEDGGDEESGDKKCKAAVVIKPDKCHTLP